MSTLRRATRSDAEACGRVQHASWVETYTGLASDIFWERATPERCVTVWESWLDDGLDATVAEVDGEIVGFAFARPTVDAEPPPVRDVRLHTLYVLAAHHGTGIGQELLDAVLPSGTPAELWVAAGNPRAIRFYERNGFVADGATDDGTTFGGIAAIRMVR